MILIALVGCTGAGTADDVSGAEAAIAQEQNGDEGVAPSVPRPTATSAPATAVPNPTATAEPVEPSLADDPRSESEPISEWPERTPRNSETAERKLEFIRFAIQQAMAAPQTTYFQTVTRFEPSAVTSNEREWESVGVWNGAYDESTGDGVAGYELQTNAPWVAEADRRSVFLVRQVGGVEWIRFRDSTGDRWIGGSGMTPPGVASSTKAFLDVDEYLTIFSESLQNVETISPNPNGSLWIVDLDVTRMDALVRIPVEPESGAADTPVSVFINVDAAGTVQGFSFQPTDWWQSSGFAEGENEELWIALNLEITEEDLSVSPCPDQVREVVEGYGEVATCAAQ